jgi:hypothetical protein
MPMAVQSWEGIIVGLRSRVVLIVSHVPSECDYSVAIVRGGETIDEDPNQ